MDFKDWIKSLLKQAVREVLEEKSKQTSQSPTPAKAIQKHFEQSQTQTR